MTAEEFVPAVFLRATGKIATFVTGSPKWLKILGIGNAYIRTWAREKGVDWYSLYSIVDNSTITATDTFDIDPTIRKISQRDGDSIRVVHSDGIAYTDYRLVPADKLKQYTHRNAVAKIGNQLKFSRPFTDSSPQINGTLQVPVFLYPEAIVEDADEVPVDDPDWLVVISAAEYIRNDITRQNQYGNLTAEANELMEAMKADNDSQDDEIDRPWNPLGSC